MTVRHLLEIDDLTPAELDTVLRRAAEPPGGDRLLAGRTVGLVECDVVDESDNLVAYAVSTCLILRGDTAAGR